MFPDESSAPPSHAVLDDDEPTTMTFNTAPNLPPLPSGPGDSSEADSREPALVIHLDPNDTGGIFPADAPRYWGADLATPGYIPARNTTKQNSETRLAELLDHDKERWKDDEAGRLAQAQFNILLKSGGLVKKGDTAMLAELKQTLLRTQDERLEAAWNIHRARQLNIHKANLRGISQISYGKTHVRVPLSSKSAVYRDIERYIGECLKKQKYEMSKKETEKFLTDVDPSKAWMKDLDKLIPTINEDSIYVDRIEVVINAPRWATYRGYADNGVGLKLPPRGDSDPSGKKKWSKSEDFPWLCSPVCEELQLPCLSIDKGEYYLFHGTGPVGVEGICDHGFDPGRCRKSETIGIYGSVGQGAYLSDNFAKCAAYSRCEHCDYVACLCKHCQLCGQWVQAGDACFCGEKIHHVDPLRPVLLSRVAYKEQQDRVRVSKNYVRRRRSVASLLEKQKTSPATTICEGRPKRNWFLKKLDRRFGNNDFIVYRNEMAYTEFVVWYRRQPRPAVSGGSSSSSSGSGSSPAMVGYLDGAQDRLTPGGLQQPRYRRLRCLAQDMPSCGQRAVFNIAAMRAHRDDTNAAQNAMNDDPGLKAIGGMVHNIHSDDVHALLLGLGIDDQVVVIQSVYEIRFMLGTANGYAIAPSTPLMNFYNGLSNNLYVVLNTVALDTRFKGGSHWIAVHLQRSASGIELRFADSLERAASRKTLMNGLLEALGLPILS